MGDAKDFLAGRAEVYVALAENRGQPPAAHLIQGSVAMRAERGFVVSLFASDHIDLLSPI
jgi:hypothetical protein